MNRYIFDTSAEKIGYQIVVEKGQRLFLPKDTDFITNSDYNELKKYEVFFSNLPFDLYENELLPFLCRIGPVYQIRQIMNFSGATKGMAYVVFTTVEHAFEAVDQLDGEYIRMNCTRRVRASFSVNNNRLLLGPISIDKTPEEVKEELNNNMSNVEEVKLYQNNNQVNNAMVTFTSHQAAANARRALVPTGSKVRIFGQKLTAEWAKPKDSKSLFVRFNCSFFNQYLVKNFFENHLSQLKMIRITNVTILGRNSFVKFATFREAYFVYKHFRQIEQLPVCVKEYLTIEDISWPIRK